jgi:hypothetical protein
MTKKTKDIIRKGIYAIIFIAMLGAFIYLGNKYAGNSEVKVLTINDYYNEIKKENFQVISGAKFIKLFDEGKHIVVIGSSKSEYSQKYITEINKLVEELELKEIKYYDIINDKAQGNSNYYRLVEKLDGYLITTDTSVNNLLSPSFYIIENGKVKYYNAETSAMKNTDTAKDYWNEEKEIEFKAEITNAINKYYLNK